MMMQNKDAWSLIEKAVNDLNDDNLSVFPEDVWLPGMGDYCVTDNSLHFSTGGLKYGADIYPDEVADEYCVFSSLAALGHEWKHYEQHNRLKHMPYQQKLFMFIDENLSDYYCLNPHYKNSYYQNDMNEIEAEQFGIRFAYNNICDSFGKTCADRALSEYVKNESQAGYFIDIDSGDSMPDIDMKFSAKMQTVVHNNFPAPSCEQVCRPLLAAYEHIPSGISQLEAMSACVFQIRNYEQAKYLDIYGTVFWNRIQIKYPDIFVINQESFDVKNTFDEYSGLDGPSP